MMLIKAETTTGNTFAIGLMLTTVFKEGVWKKAVRQCCHLLVLSFFSSLWNLLSTAGDKTLDWVLWSGVISLLLDVGERKCNSLKLVFFAVHAKSWRHEAIAVSMCLFDESEAELLSFSSLPDMNAVAWLEETNLALKLPHSKQSDHPDY